MAVAVKAAAFSSTVGIAAFMAVLPAVASPPELDDPVGDAESSTQHHTANGDGVLSEEELTALAAISVDEVAAADLADVTEPDLSRLPTALQDRIREPVRLRYREVDPMSQADFPGLQTLATSTKQVQGQWWHENAYGWHLTDYFVAVSFSYNGSKVIDPSDWSWGNGNWGYQFCGEDARGSRWVNSGHTHFQAFGRGRFGPPGCDVVVYTNGGTLNVNGSGSGWLS